MGACGARYIQGRVDASDLAETVKIAAAVPEVTDNSVAGNSGDGSVVRCVRVIDGGVDAASLGKAVETAAAVLIDTYDGIAINAVCVG